VLSDVERASRMVQGEKRDSPGRKGGKRKLLFSKSRGADLGPARGRKKRVAPVLKMGRYKGREKEKEGSSISPRRKGELLQYDP